jgi:hypothetical protein
MTVATTYTNSVSYLQHRNEIDAERLGYINSVLYGASFLKMVPIVPANDFMQDKHMERNQGTTKRTQKRKLNEELQAGTFNPFAPKTELTAIYSTEPTSMDFRLAEKDPAQFDAMMARDAEDLIMDIDYDIINGTPDASGYGLNGLKNRIPIGDANFNIDNSSPLTINTSATTFKTFLREFRAAVRKIKLSPGMQVVCFCNETVDLGVQSGRDELGANVVGVGTTDILNQRVTTIDNVPLVIVRGDSVGTETLAFDETGSTTSIYICGIGGSAGQGSTRPNGLVILSSDEVIRDRYHQTLTQYQGVQEIDIGLLVPKRSVARISGLKVAS